MCFSATIDTDLTKAAAVLDDLFHLTGHRTDAQPFAEMALEMLLEHWRAVEGVASALIDNGRVEGRWVEWLIDYATGLDPPLPSR